MKNKETVGKYSTPESRWAGVGPYYAMFPTEFAVDVIKEHTKKGQCVLDPFAGRATSLFAASTHGRVGLGVEINPVGWVYGKAKLQTARKVDVENKLHFIGRQAASYRREADHLPEFFRWCFCPRVLEFLVAARDILEWRRKKTDWTTMALLLVDLHGKRQNSLSNQMRQTKSMSPQYAVKWWKKHGKFPPDVDPVEFMMKKVQWRYRKGRIVSGQSRIYLGDSRTKLKDLARSGDSRRAKLLLTSPPYHAVTNYFYDQWLRLWLLGGSNRPCSPREKYKGKFENKDDYTDLLKSVFSNCTPLLMRNAIVYVRTDARRFTYNSTLQALEQAFPNKKIRSEERSRPPFTQTSLFDSRRAAVDEVDLTMW